ncbi:MAG: protein adenylyltransferase SelO family protein [Campylobacterota bacterium]|nr:protein adenylyltransferase SelO family protein [Campylobacterota bacterium]
MKKTETFQEFAQLADYSFIKSLNKDPQSKEDGIDHSPREVFSGHYVKVKPTPIKEPKYITHSKKFFSELNLDDTLAISDDFIAMFSGDSAKLPKPLSKTGWACGYALSIYGTEYYEQCPFQSGNGYGDGRAISIFEGILNGKRWEMQLKGGGKTPYCRGADGRAVLRSSVREFLAQEHMNALGIATSRSLSLYTSKSETVKRPWFKQNSYSKDPEVMIDEAVAISTRVAPSFIRVGQIELFARRARKNEHPKALDELEKLLLHTIDREYDEIDSSLKLDEKILLLAKEFRKRLSSLVTNWIRVGYCQGNFNSDNCAVGGFGLDYGPFGFIDMFDPQYQPWTGGGVHFSFFNQSEAARQNFNMFCKSLSPLLVAYPEALEKLNQIRDDFAKVIQKDIEKMWEKKLGIDKFDEELFTELMVLMTETGVDYTIFFRELSNIPKDIDTLKKSFYGDISSNKSIQNRWSNWLEKWNSTVRNTTSEMKKINPKYTLRESILVKAYTKAQDENYKMIEELQEVMNNPYDEQSKEIEEKYYKKKPNESFGIAGISHISCSS